MKHQYLFYRLATALVVVSLLALGATAAPADPTPRYGDDIPTAMVLVPLDGAGGVAAAPAAAQAAGLTPYGLYSGPRGEFLLAGAAWGPQKAELALGIPLHVLDRDTTGGMYYLAMMPPGVAGPDWAAYGRVLLDDGAQVLLRTTAGEAERLAEAGAEIAQIMLAPMVVAPVGGEALVGPAAITPDPLIQGMLNQVISTTVSAYDAQLSGEQPVTLSDGSYTIATRHTSSGTPIQKARQFVGEHLAGLGYSVEYHSWTKSGYSNVNVVGQRTGTVSPNDIYMIGAHLDDMPTGATAPGADDNASGSVATLVAADILTQYEWSCTLRFAFWTGEEQGLLGSSVYTARSKTNGETIKGYLNLDMLGYNATAPRNLDLYYRATPAGSEQIADTFIDVVNAYGLNLTPTKYNVATYTIGNQSDNKSFWDQGYPAILTIENYQGGDFTPSYHTVNDRLSTLDLDYFTTMVKAAVGTLAHMSGCLIGPAATPAPPSNLTASAVSGSQINLAWTDGSTNELGFKIERCTGSGCSDFAQVATVVANVTSFSDTGLASSTSYSYRVRAYNGAGDSGYTNVASATTLTPPAPPSNLTASAVSASQINLAWTDGSADELGFKIERCTGASCSNFSQVVTVTADVTSYSDTGLASGMSYSYRVRAYNGVGDSSYSNVASATTLGPSNTGWLSPSANAPVTSGAGDNNGFEVNPANAYADDGVFAVDNNSGSNSNTSCTNSGKDKHRYYNYNISIPGGATVAGIEVRLDAKVDSASNAPKMCVQLSWDGGTTWTATKSTPTLTTSEATYILGGAADTWGRAWTVANLSNTSFRVRIIDVASSTARDFSLDWAAVRVTYQ